MYNLGEEKIKIIIGENVNSLVKMICLFFFIFFRVFGFNYNFVYRYI